jgi:hypothetical protein
MRTKTTLLTAALLAVGAISATAQSNVYSLNVVGYVNKAVPTGFSLIQNPLNNPAGNSLEQTIGTNVLDGTVVYQFNNGTYTTIATFIGGPGANFWDSSATLDPGKGFFLFSPAPQTLTFTGEVMQGSLSNHYPAGFSIVGSQVPQAGGLSALGMQVQDQAVVYTYANGTYSINTYWGVPTVPAGSEFWDGGSEPTLAVGESFFLSSPAQGSFNRNFTVQ